MISFSDHCWWEMFLLSWERIGSDASWDLSWLIAGDAVQRLEAWHAANPKQCRSCAEHHGEDVECPEVLDFNDQRSVSSRHAFVDARGGY